MHPYYQDFYLDDPQLDSLFEVIQDEGLLLTMHTGYDFAFEWIDRASPSQIATVIDKFPNLKLVTTHLGAWQQWDGIEELLIGKPIYMETSFSLKYLDHKRLKRMLLAHPSEFILFGTDSPWTDQKNEIEGLKKLGLPSDLLDKIFYNNALKLLQAVSK
jgi:predicted TIM-barrel fold metal-dependent hydrolase